MDVPEEIETGYPPMKFKFTGEWLCYPHCRSKRVSIRNNYSVWSPLYKSEDGTTIMLATIVAKSDPKLSGWTGKPCPHCCGRE